MSGFDNEANDPSNTSNGGVGGSGYKNADSVLVTEGKNQFLPMIQLWGFDPMELLKKVQFPNDKVEELIRSSKSARQRAIRREKMQELEPQGANFTRTNPESNTKISLLNLSEDASKSTNSSNDEIRIELFARSAAAVMIQTCYKGWSTRKKFFAVKYFRESEHSQYSTAGSLSKEDYEKDWKLKISLNYSSQELLIQKYRKYCGILEKNLKRRPSAMDQNRFPPTMPFFCATYIQSFFKMSVLSKAWKKLCLESKERKFKGIPINIKEIKLYKQETLKNAFQGKKIEMVYNWDQAATKIQTAWKSYYNSKIYHFYRDLIKFRETGDPKKLLKFINPQEANLIDGSSGIHVRFRLGGLSFPPTIYYKIFLHNSIIDMNSFSPRNYADESTKQMLPRDLFSNGKEIPKVNEKDSWYQRYENNGWRPVSDKVWNQYKDPVTYETSQKCISFHFSKLKRRDEIAKRKKQKKLDWLKKLYQEGKQIAEQSKHPYDDSSSSTIDTLTIDYTIQDFENTNISKEIDFKNEQELLMALEDLDLDTDEDMLNWSKALDFDWYYQDWAGLATTGRSDEPGTFEMFANNETNNKAPPPIIGSATETRFTASKLSTPQLTIIPSDVSQKPLLPVKMTTKSMMEEIDLFKSISKQEFLDSSVAKTKKERPSSAKSARSARDLLL